MTNAGSENNRLEGLIQAINNDDHVAVDQWIRSERFTLVALASDENDEDALSALVVETEEFPAVVAFMDSEAAQTFVDSIADQIEGESVDLFEVDGESLLRPMSEEFGLLINPESDEAVMVEPGLLHSECGCDGECDGSEEEEQDGSAS
ncbi:hypothetical protein SH467x_001399 [Pirellulaceae bacterium SH467]|jgi:hypothetical protein